MKETGLQKFFARLRKKNKRWQCWLSCLCRTQLKDVDNKSSSERTKTTTTIDITSLKTQSPANIADRYIILITLTALRRPDRLKKSGYKNRNNMDAWTIVWNKICIWQGQNWNLPKRPVSMHPLPV